ncbi:hypothetical protein DFA_03648 [Cavenderia fasciculata]|uniref:Pescadillo homolog n=1 Tax=Cavenderia fasciculata TaxID=261658 RepID=F4PIH0_CACFS|nr:uncharacterized protein DFA_03648 [Cavenderia fasciculata]EGG25399.1 hypothetical protein DFA_03648 [Cavenderia fasciculata]|eukprot:XP_004363250.1 hypothetical protein DFA_03648 [Cavenderia fasciculata]
MSELPTNTKQFFCMSLKYVCASIYFCYLLLKRVSKMAIKVKKGTKGDSVNYITRNAACRKLGLSLKMFRKLCILKGIHPRDPKKKLKGKNKTYYFTKDVKFLRHDPIISTLRERKALFKKEKKLREKKQTKTLELLIARRPRISMDHIVKERYPTFSDAIRDLDDCLTLIHLFASMDSSPKVREQHIITCSTLAREFQMYIASSNSLRKVFVTVKGIYYQAEIMGETVTWLTPMNYLNKKERDVDYGIMINFLEFYECLLKFVNYRLYTSIGLKYPPTIDQDQLGNGNNLSALITESVNKATPSTKPVAATKKMTAVEMAQQRKINALNKKVGQEEEEEEVEEEVEELEINAQGVSKDFEGLAAEGEEGDATVAQLRDPSKLFKGLKFFASRECPIVALEFVIKAFGGEFYWNFIKNEEVPEFITHVITERTGFAKKDLSKEYIQPQWVFDSINNNILLNCQEYALGVVMPPHLSPFVEYNEDSYIPARKAMLDQLINQKGFESAVINMDEQDQDMEDDQDGKKNNKKRKSMDQDDEQDSDAESEDSDNDEDVAAALESKYMSELQQENLQISSSTKPQQQQQQPKKTKNNNTNNNNNTQQTQIQELKDKVTQDEKTLGSKLAKKKKQAEREELEMVERMMTKKNKGLYHSVKNEVSRQTNEKKRLEHKRGLVESGKNVDGVQKKKAASAAVTKKPQQNTPNTTTKKSAPVSQTIKKSKK